MDRSLIYQMLAKLPPERLGQLISEVQATEGDVTNVQTGGTVGSQSSMIQQRNVPPMYRGPIRRVQ